MLNDPDDSIRVLIVDDHKMFADSLARLLGDECGIDVLGIANTGEQAVEMCARLAPTVVLVDYQLPDTNGAVLAGELKSADPDVMIVMLTGANEDRVLLDAIDAGCCGFITKDRAAVEVVEAVRGAAAGEALISPLLLARLLPKLKRTYRSLGSDLTERERATLNRLAEGWSNKAIAADLNLSLNTVRNYVQSLLSKLGAHSKLEAVSTAVREGIIDYPTRA
ncbi:MAG: response regulator transcription factor [Ilumatobacteraceae bacterium]|nr:response regulator transcription factor [Ilumatobacteraceae bacterium]